MALNIDSHAAAFGRFQIAFAHLDARLSRCLAKLHGYEDEKLAFAIFMRKPLSQRIRMIREAVKTVADESSLSEQVRELKKACDIAAMVSKWRNKLIHAEVR